MCGRYALLVTSEELAELLGMDPNAFPDFSRRYNIAPSQDVLIVREPGSDSGREVVLVRWGLVPFWADDPDDTYRTINARAEEAHKKPTYREPFKKKRCVIPASGFYEWQKDPDSKNKQPWFVHREDGEPLFFAGLWDRWSGEGSDSLETCTIMTTAANDELKSLHPRMPVVLSRSEVDQWLDPEIHEREALSSLLESRPWPWMAKYKVSRHVNSPRNDDEGCIEPLDDDAPKPGMLL